MGRVFEVEELVAEDVGRAAADRLHADPGAGVHHPVPPHPHVGAVVIDLDAVVDAVGRVVAVDVVAVRLAGERLHRDAVAEVPHPVAADDVAPAAEVDAAFGGNADARPGHAAFDDVVAHGLVALVTAVPAVVDPEVDVSDVVVPDHDLRAALGVDAPRAVLERHPLDHDIRDRLIVLAEGDHPAVGAGAVDHRRAVTGPGEDDRLRRRAAGQDLERLVGSRGDVEVVARLRVVGGGLETLIGVAGAAVAAARARHHVAVDTAVLVGWRDPGARHHGLDIRAAVGVGQGQPQLVALTRRPGRGRLPPTS